MDCGSGLILLIRQNMLEVPVGGVLEIRSSEPTVVSELPPWCRMVSHSHLGSEEVSSGRWHHWVQRGSDQATEKAELESDRQKAQQFKWSLRARQTDGHQTTVYSRNFSWQSGASIDFDRKSETATSLEQFLGSLLANVIACFSIRCSRLSMVVDDLEATLNATLVNSLAAAGFESGDPSIETIALTVYLTTSADDAMVEQAWQAGLQDSPVFQTLIKSCQIDARIVTL